MTLEIKSIATEDEFLSVKKINISLSDVNRLNRKIIQEVKLNNIEIQEGIIFLDEHPKRHRVKINQKKQNHL